MNTKTLYFAQHGLALDKKEDPERALSSEGISQTQAIADHLRENPQSPKHIYHSGKLRALQTAKILAETITINALEIKQQNHLSPNDDIQLLIPELEDESLYIGHLPHLEKLVSYLVSGDEDQNIIRFKNSAIVCLKKENAKDEKELFHIHWYLTAELLMN